MAASADDKFLLVGEPGTATTLAAPGYTQGNSGITVESTTNFPTTTGVIFAMDTSETANGVERRLAGSLSVFAGVVDSEDTITDLEFLAGTPQDYVAGATTRVYITVSSQHNQRLIEGILAHANQDGSLKTAAVQAALGLGTDALNGWNALAYSPDTVTADGAHNYSLVFNGHDVTDVLSPGMRIRTTRTVPAPVQCTSLNGTNQSWVKASPSGVSFIDDFATSVSVKLTSYPTVSAGIITRYDGTSGWELRVISTGQVELIGYNAGATNYSLIRSTNSLPLNSWVHISAQLDMSSFTVSGTTSYIMFDGYQTSLTVIRNGTNPTALVQAGSLEIGSSNGTAFLAGKIAQAAVFSSKVSQSTMRGYMSQGLSGSETDLVSGYSFSGGTTDLKVANANNLSANGSAVATNADSPFGGQGDNTISNTLDYGIIQKSTFSTNTTLIVHVAGGCTIPTSGGVSAVVYSGNRIPYKFPSSKYKWRLQSLFNINGTTGSPTAGTWYNPNAQGLYIPVGSWVVGFAQALYGARSSGSIDLSYTLTTTNLATGDFDLTANIRSDPSATFVAEVSRSKPIDVASPDTYYGCIKSGASSMINIIQLNDASAGIIYADNAYL